MRLELDKLGTVGALVAAVFCPICFPKLALIGAALGLGALAPFEGWFVAAAQVFLVLALAGHVVAYRLHRERWPPLLAGASVLTVIVSLWVHYAEVVVYAGLGGLITATLWGAILARRPAAISALPGPPGYRRCSGEVHRSDTRDSGKLA